MRKAMSYRSIGVFTIFVFTMSAIMTCPAYSRSEADIISGAVGIFGAMAGSASRASKEKERKKREAASLLGQGNTEQQAAQQESIRSMQQRQEAASTKQRQQQALVEQAIKFSQEYQSANPQAWQVEINKVNLASGEKVYEKDYDQVFDSVITALSNLGMKIDSIEKQSGVINATGNPLPSDLRKKLNFQKASDYAKLEGYDPVVLDQNCVTVSLNTKDAYNPLGLTVRVINQANADNKETNNSVSALMYTGNKKNADNQTAKTKIKLRIVRESYPSYATEVYKVVWNEVDKQLFLDSNIDR